MSAADSNPSHTPTATSQSRLGSIGKRAKNNLVTLGSVAVFTVYAAGYARTSEAAHRFDDADGGERRRPVPEPNIGVVGESTSPVGRARDVDQSAGATSPGVAPTRAGNTVRVAAESAVTSANASAGASAASVPTNTPGTTASAPPTSAVTEPARATDSAATKSPPVPAPAGPDSAARVAQAAADSAAQVERERGQFKDGTYYGWGTSRHGDIQAGVEIRNGKIYDAWIQQCLTRYSCSWISRLPGQVVARQSPDVDYVSGATQSTNAFYYAVAQAITRAK